MDAGAAANTARKADTLYIPDAAGRIGERIGGSRDTWTTDTGRKAAPTPVAPLIKAEEARLRAALLKRLAQRKEDEPTEALKNGKNPITDVFLPALDRPTIDSAEAYIPLPAWKARADITARLRGWRIELCEIVSGMKPLGFDILADVLIGRGPEADIDLEPYGAFDQAVSRRHAVLRPTENHLYLIDMSSTNGTLYNSVPLGRCATHAVEHNDIITLGMLSFAIRIVDGPYRG